MLLAQTEFIDLIEAVLSRPTDVLLAGVLFGMMIAGIIVARAFARWVANVDKMFARRDEIDAGLMTVIKDTGTAINSSVAASNKSASTAERTEQAVVTLSTQVKQGNETQRVKVMPALAAIYKGLTQIEGKLDKCDNAEIHRELKELRADLRAAIISAQKPTTVVVGDTSKLSPSVVNEGNNHHET